MDLEALSDFVLVAANGGITQASRASGRPKATLSRKVMELEASLGVRLFERGARSIHLTAEGETLFSRTSGPLGEIAEVTELLRDGRSRPSGRLRISLPTVFGQILLGKLAADFTKAYPEVKLDAIMEDREVELVAEGYDVVIRLNPTPNSTLVGRCFARDQLLIVAAPSLVAPADKANDTEYLLPVVRRNGATDRNAWRMPGPDGAVVQTRTVLELPTFPTVRDAVLTGIGAAKLPQVLVTEDLATGRLISWGPATERPAELWVLHSSSRLPGAKVKAFARFLEKAFPDGHL
jgi:DNA-binding transcriptional LysR family regulator